MTYSKLPTPQPEPIPPQNTPPRGVQAHSTPPRTAKAFVLPADLTANTVERSPSGSVFVHSSSKPAYPRIRSCDEKTASKLTQQEDGDTPSAPPCAEENAEDETPFHSPEIVLTKHTAPYAGDSEENGSGFAVRQTDNRKARFLPSLGVLTAVCTLCLVSFVIGCSVSDRALCRVLIAITTAASGRVSTDGADSLLPGGDGGTVYQRYKTAPPAHEDSVSYLGLPPNQENPENADENSLTPPKTASGETEIAADADINGKIGADGAVLYPVFARDISASDLHSLSNETRYSPNTYALLQSTPAALQNLTIDPEKPLVLIVHTHGTECYNACDREGFYDAALPVRSEDTAQNVVGIGSEVAQILNDFGIPTLHSEKMCDKDSFIRAYSTSAAEVKTYLENYPSIRFVIDLHRDSIAAADASKTKPVFSLAGESTAQLMLVVGTDAAGANHPSWENNLSLALRLQSEMAADYPTLFRRINLRSASFNQQLSDGYLLLECGSCANSREEAARAARIFATGFARLIKNAAA